jgi:PAS domain S-box-containing protein
MLFLRQIFGPGEFTPHGYCYLWNPGLVWLHVISDSLIAISYFTIPFALLWFVRKGRDIPFGFIFVLFGTFIIACGSTHVMEVWNLWHSEYWLAGGLKAITAIASVATAVAVTRLLPQAIGLRSVAEWSAANAALEQEVRARRELEASLLSTVATAREQSELLELIHDAIFVRNLQNEIVFWNRGAERLYGWSKDEVVGQTTHDLLQTVFPCDLELIKAAVLKEGHWEGELKHTTRGGRTVAVSSRWALRVGENGEPVGVLESNRDLTKLKYEEQKFRVLVEGIKDYSIVGLDLDGVVSTWNPGAERIKGYRAAEIIGKHFSCFYSQADAAIGKPAEMLRLAVQYGVVEEEGWRVRKDGSQFWADVIIRALYDDANNLIGFAKITRDGTGRRNLEQELRNANEFLEHRVSDRTLELATANAQLLNRQQEISALNESLEGG